MLILSLHYSKKCHRPNSSDVKRFKISFCFGINIDNATLYVANFRVRLSSFILNKLVFIFSHDNEWILCGPFVAKYCVCISRSKNSKCMGALKQLATNLVMKNVLSKKKLYSILSNSIVKRDRFINSLFSRKRNLRIYYDVITFINMVYRAVSS